MNNITRVPFHRVFCYKKLVATRKCLCVTCGDSLYAISCHPCILCHPRILCHSCLTSFPFYVILAIQSGYILNELVIIVKPLMKMYYMIFIVYVYQFQLESHFVLAKDSLKCQLRGLVLINFFSSRLNCIEF